MIRPTTIAGMTHKIVGGSPGFFPGLNGIPPGLRWIAPFSYSHVITTPSAASFRRIFAKASSASLASCLAFSAASKASRSAWTCARRAASAFSAAARCSGVSVYAPPPAAAKRARCFRSRIASSSSLSTSLSSSPSALASTAAARWTAAAVSISARFLAAAFAAFADFFSASLRSAFTRSFLDMRDMRSRSSSSSSESESEPSPPEGLRVSASVSATGACGFSGARVSVTTGACSSSELASSSEDATAFFLALPFLPLPPPPPPLRTPFLRTYTSSSFTRLALLPIIFFTLGSLSGLFSKSSARTFFSLSSPSAMGRSRIWLSLRKSSASSEHLLTLSGTDATAHRFAENVTRRSLVSNARPSNARRLGLPSSTSVTSVTHPASASHAESVNALFASRKFSSAPHFFKEAGKEDNALSSTSSTLSWLKSPIASGSVVRLLFDKMSVFKPARREISSGTRVIPRRHIFKLFVAVAHHTAGSTSAPLGNAARPFVPSKVSSLDSACIAF
mmetsp:Transcript_6819/g.29026  ORF Transcript_6819/g.29026 Transcript_6819/m.29026 type:complete len:507 (+) Transcript_6819:259-1779(+)